MLPLQVVIFTDKRQLHYSEEAGELLKWQLCGGHGTSPVRRWAAQWRRCRLYRVVNLHGPPSAEVRERKAILTSESQIRKRDFILRLDSFWLRSRSRASAKCIPPTLTWLSWVRIHQLLTKSTFFFITSCDWHVDCELDSHQWVWPSLKKTTATAIQQQ